uniref:Uncharacterized protein n=1 Tax=Ciona savignyi TaxID=51511 RepID=H2YML4_CIOSA
MNFNRDSSVYGRRRAFMTRSCSGYLKGGIPTSKESLDDDIDETSDTSSVQSTTSTRSYRDWRKGQRKRKNLAKIGKTQSLFGDASSRDDDMKRHIDPFSFDIRRAPMHSVEDSFTIDAKEDSRNISSSSVDIPRHDVTMDSYDVGAPFNELSTIVQSPVEPYYSSSSLDSLSHEEMSEKPKIPDDDVINDQQWRLSEEHQDTRDWLISKALPPAQNNANVIKKIPNVIEKTTEPSKRSRDPSLDLGFGAGLNELSLIFDPKQKIKEGEVSGQPYVENTSVKDDLPKLVSSTPSSLEKTSIDGPISSDAETGNGGIPNTLQTPQFQSEDLYNKSEEPNKQPEDHNCDAQSADQYVDPQNEQLSQEVLQSIKDRSTIGSENTPNNTPETNQTQKKTTDNTPKTSKQKTPDNASKTSKEETQDNAPETSKTQEKTPDIETGSTVTISAASDCSPQSNQDPEDDNVDMESHPRDLAKALRLPLQSGQHDTSEADDPNQLEASINEDSSLVHD